MANLTIKQNDTLRTISDALTVGGAPLNLAGAVVRFAMRLRDTGEKLKFDASIVSEAAGTVSFQLTTAATAKAGVWDFEWEVTFGSSAITIPDSGYNTLTIESDLG